MPSYHDLHITTAEIKRTSIFGLTPDFMVTCTRLGGWELWRGEGIDKTLIVGEYGGGGLKLDIHGTVIVDSLTERDSDF